MEEFIQIFSTFNNLSRDLIVLYGSGKVRWINKAGLDALGYQLMEVVGRDCIDFFHEESKQAASGRIDFKRRKENQVLSPIELQLLRKDKVPVWFEITSTLLSLEDFRLVMAVGKNISERKESEKLIIDTLLGLLPVRQSKLLNLLLQGKDYEDIMKIMDLNFENVKRYHRRIFQRLEKKLDEESLVKILKLLE